MSNPKPPFLRALLKEAVRLDPNCSFSQSCTDFCVPASAPRTGVLRHFYTVQPSPVLPSPQQMKLPPISQRSLKPYTVNSQPPVALIQNLFLSSPVFCLFLVLVSESYLLSTLSLSTHLWDCMHYNPLAGVRGLSTHCHPHPSYL